MKIIRNRKYKLRNVKKNCTLALSNVLIFGGLLLTFFFSGTREDVSLTKTVWMLILGIVCIAVGVLIQTYNDKNYF